MDTKRKRKVAIRMSLVILLSAIFSSAPENTYIAKAELLRPEAEWNIERLHAETSYEDSVHLPHIKVAVLDSGLDYDTDIPYVERKDFLGDKKKNPVYQDYTGHGTGVASLICARKNADKITGIAANVDLYVARILDKGNASTIERVVQAVKWAMEKKVHIIHMSFGTKTYSKELDKIIEKAYQQGILIVAAAGNDGTAPEDESTIEYPAAFDSVIAVGATNTRNFKTESSATGEELDVVAPGEQILAAGHFGGVSVREGTSISAAQVTGIAAVLWGRHPKQSNVFIRSLLLGSANQAAVGDNCGRGIVDYEQSNANYQKMNAVYQISRFFGESEETAVENAADTLGENKKTLSKRTVNYVNGSWNSDTHSTFIDGAELSEDYLKIVKAGIIEPDFTASMKIMSAHPYFHGGGNYIANTQYLYRAARAYFKAGDSAGVALPEYNKVFKKKSNPFENLKSMKTSKVDVKKYLGASLDDFFKKCKVKNNTTANVTQSEINKRKGYALLGLALHNATDAVAHRGYRWLNNRWVRIVHDKKEEAGSISWLWGKMAENRTSGLYKTLYEDATVADEAEKFKERIAKTNIFVKNMICQYTSTKDCYNCFASFAKEKIKGYRMQNFQKYWNAVGGKKKCKGFSREDKETLTMPEAKDVTVRVTEQVVSFEFKRENEQSYVLCQPQAKIIVYLGTAVKKKGDTYKIQVKKEAIQKNKFRLYVFNEFKSDYFDFSVSCKVKFSLKGVNQKTDKKKVNKVIGSKKEKKITYNPKKPIPMIENKKKKDGKTVAAFVYKYKSAKEKKENPKVFLGWSTKPKGKVMTGFVYKNKRDCTLYPIFGKKEKTEKKAANGK